MSDLSSFKSGARWVGHPTIFHATTGSTNDDARALAADGCPAGTLVIADAQTSGRGRRGRTWNSPPGDNLYFSLVLRPSGDPASIAPLPLVVGLAVAECLNGFVPDRRVCVKWPNDVRVDGDKLAGVLVESSIAHGGLAYVIVGIGINVQGEAPPAGLTQPATTLRAVRKSQVSREEVLASLVLTMEERLDALARDGFEGALQASVTARCETLGRRVRVDGVEGIATAIGSDGALLIARGHESVPVRAGDITEVPGGR